MSVPAKLTGGALVRRDPNRLPVPPQAESPFIRLEDPLDLYLSTGCMALFQRASALVHGTPDSAYAEVAVRDVAGQKYLLIAPTTEDNPRKADLRRRADQGGARIRTADDVLKNGGVVGAPGVAYKMDAHLVQDSELQWVVAANWTAAQPARR